MEATTPVRHTTNGEGTAPEQRGVIPPVAPSIGDPAPLRLAAFALTTFVLSFFNAGLVSGKGLPVVLGLALAYGGIAQLLAGMWEFRNNNTFGATAFSSFGAFWISSFRVSVAVMLVFLLLAATFFVLGIGESNGTESIVKAGGWLGIATAIVAWYASFASVTNK